MASQRDHCRSAWIQCLVFLCLACTVVTSQTVGDASSDAGSSSHSASPPSFTTPITTAPVPTIPATTAPTPTTTAKMKSPATKTPTPTTSAPTASTVPSPESAPETSTPTQTTTAPAATTSQTSTRTTAPVATSMAVPSATTDTATSSPTSTTASPAVQHYNSSTLPPGVSSSVLNGSDLVSVEVTETTLGDGTTSYSYIIVTDTGETEKVVVVSSSTDGQATTSTSSESNSAQSDSSSSGSSSTFKSSGSLGLGAIIGIVVGGLVVILALFAFLAVQRRRYANRSNDASSDATFALPAVGKQARLLNQNQSMADTEYEDATRTLPHSQVSGVSILSSRRYRGTMWEDPVIVASRIPIDHIELEDIISRGAFGLVRRGRYRDQDVAVKTLLPEKRKDMTHIEGFLSEVKLVATMEHPNIVQFIGVAWESLSELYCVTEFMSGGDLRSLLRDYLATGTPQGMDASKMQIAYDVAYALTYLHSLEPAVLHRDLKSRNILLTQSLNAKITDFGTSRLRSDGSMTSNVGSSLWMAPEVMMGRRYDEKADVFSLGVVISELDTHELPYSHAKESNNNKGRPLPDTAVLQMVSMGKLCVRFSPFMQQNLGYFIERCVDVNPRERPTAAEVFYYLQVAIRSHDY